MRIGFLTCDLSESHGWGTYSLNVLRQLQAAGIDLRIYTARNSLEQPDLPVQGRVLPNVVPAEAGLLVKQMLLSPTISSAFKDCDIIHSSIEPYAPLARWLAGRRPCFVTAHGSYVRSLPKRRWPGGMLYREALRRSHLVCVSSYTARVAQETLPGVRTSVISNGIDAARFSQPSTVTIETGGPVVLSVGAVKSRKGVLELVQAMAQVRAEIPDVQCVIIGGLDDSPDYVAQVRAVVAGLNLENTVHLLGRVDDETLAGWYAAADLFVQPAKNTGERFEGFGLVYLEASAAGLPVIGTTDCGAEDAIEDGVTGLLLPQSAVTAALPGAIISLLSDHARARQMGAAGRAWAQRHTWKANVEQLVGLYETALT